jgi:hypothetical protein
MLHPNFGEPCSGEVPRRHLPRAPVDIRKLLLAAYEARLNISVAAASRKNPIAKPNCRE